MNDNVKALQKLTRARFFAANNLAREKNRFLNYLFLKFSSLAQEDIFSNTFGKASIAVITTSYLWMKLQIWISRTL